MWHVFWCAFILFFFLLKKKLHRILWHVQKPYSRGSEKWVIRNKKEEVTYARVCMPFISGGWQSNLKDQRTVNFNSAMSKNEWVYVLKTAERNGSEWISKSATLKLIIHFVETFSSEPLRKNKIKAHTVVKSLWNVHRNIVGNRGTTGKQERKWAQGLGNRDDDVGKKNVRELCRSLTRVSVVPVPFYFFYSSYAVHFAFIYAARKITF